MWRDLLGAQLVRVAARDDDVFQLGARADVREGALPALGVDAQLELRDLLGVDADRVAARAKAAVHRTGVEGQEQRLVDVAVGQAGHRHVGPLVQRIQVQARVIGQKARRQRHELRPQRILVRVAPVDERQQVRRDPHRHRRALEPALRVRDEVLRDQARDRRQQLRDVRHRMLGLPLVVQELGFGDLRVGRDGPPELAAQQVAVRQRPRVDRWLQRRWRRHIHLSQFNRGGHLDFDRSA